MNIKKTLTIIFMIILVSNIVISQENFTQKDALSAIEKSKEDIRILEEEGFGTSYARDILFAAGQSFNRTKTAIKLGYTEFKYNDVIELTVKISATRNKSYELNDRIRAFSLQAEEYTRAGVNTNKSRELLALAKEALANERYGESDNFIKQADNQLELEKAELSLTKAVAKATKSFIEKNWKQIFAFFLFVILTTIIVWKNARIFILRRKLRDLKLEQEAIINLIKKIQKKRFEKGQISHLTYDIQIKVYKERLAELKHKIPVLESMLFNKHKVKEPIKIKKKK